MDPIPLMGVAEIRIRLGGISPQRVAVITGRDDFPRPVATLIMGRVWHRDDVEAWILERRPKLAEPAEGDG
jgi:predicted DNA-binding transcriptional regulator AlpA